MADFRRRKPSRALHRLSQQPLRGQQNHGHDKWGERGATAPLGGRIADITLATPSLPLVQNAAHTADGRLQRWTDAAGKVQTRSHNLDGQVVAYSAGGQTWQLAYDSAGRLTRIADSANPVLAADYGYDALNRLTRAVLPNTAYAYAYDANGNRKQSTIGGQVQTLSIDPASNRLLALASSPPIAYTYDPAGNRSTDGQTNYTYDAAGRLVQATSAIGTTRYQVNALNQRTRKTGPLGETTYLHDRQGHLLAETDNQGRIQREYVWLDDQLLAILDGDPTATQVYAVHPDPLGTPRAVTDPTGKLLWRAAPASEPFGLSVEQDPDGDGTPFVLNLRFPGQYFDKETNLAYNWHRYYDERVGSYTTSDPIGLNGGQWSTYGYVGGNPISYSDPLGLAPTKAVIWLVRICKKGIERIRPVSYEEAVGMAKKGEDLQSSRDMMKKVGEAASEGRGAIKDPVHPDKVTGSTEGRRPHYHVNPRNGGHLFYSIAAAATVAGHVDCEDCTMAYIAEGIDFFNPLSLPKDLMDLTGVGASD